MYKRQFKQLPKHPAITRDLALVADDAVPAADTVSYTHLMGIGVDMVSEARVARSIKRPGFLEKVYGPAERALLEGRGMRPQTAAANFAAKEAFGKALGTGLLREFALCEACLLYTSRCV